MVWQDGRAAGARRAPGPRHWVPRGRDRSLSPARLGVRACLRGAAPILAALAMMGLGFGAGVASAADSRPVKDVVLIDMTTGKKVWLKQANLSTFDIHLSDKFFPNMERPFGKMTLTTLSIQPVLGFAPREIATVDAKPNLIGQTYYVVPLDPKPCAVDTIHDPPIKDAKSLKPAQLLDAEFAFYQYAAAACAKQGGKALQVALDMFRAKTLKEACEKGGQFTCGDALELYEELRAGLEAGRIDNAHFKEGRVSPRLIRARGAQLLHRALEEGMRFYVKNRNDVDRRGVLAFLDRIIDHPLAASATKTQAKRGKKTVMGDWCNVDPKGCKEQRGSTDREGDRRRERRGEPG